MLRLALDGVIGFSDAAAPHGALDRHVRFRLGRLLRLYVVTEALSDVSLVCGWASTVVMIAFFSGINLLMTGVVGLYVGRIHEEVKARPLYIVGRAVGFEHPIAAETLRNEPESARA